MGSTDSTRDQPDAPAGPYRWLVVGMLWFVCLFNYADRQAISSVFDPIQKEMGLNEVQLGVVGGAFAWVYAAALPLAGLVGDRVNRKALVLGGLVFWSIVTLLTARSTEYWHLVFFRGLEGFGEAFYMPASLSLISDYHGPRTRSRAMALHQSSVYAGTVLGSSVAGLLADLHGWRVGFYVFGALGVLLAGVLVMFLHEPPRREAAERGGWAAREFFTNRTALLLTAVFAGANFVALIFLTWMPKFLKEKFGMSLTLSGLNGTVWLQAASAVGVIVGGLLADRWARRWRGGRMAVQALGLFLGAPLIFLCGGTLSVRVLVLAMIGFGFFKGLYDANIWAALFDFVPPRRRASAQGFMNALGWLGGAPAPVIVGLVARVWGLSPAISAASVIYLFVALLLVGRLRRPLAA